LSDSGLVRDIEGDIDSLIQQATSLQEPSLGEENEILGAIVQEYDLEDFWVMKSWPQFVNKMERSKLQCGTRLLGQLV